MEPKASVIIPVYNAETTLRRCVESLVLGSERNIEVILVEDQSKDNSWQACKELSEDFPNVICIQNAKNSGVSYTRNQGLSVAQGQFIFFVDSDDWVSGRYVQELLYNACQQPDCLTMCALRFVNHLDNYQQVFYWDNNKERVNVLEKDRFFDLVDAFFLQSPCNKAFRRDVIEKNHIRFDESQSMGEDFQFVLDYMEAAGIKKCVVLNDALYYYIRWNNTSLMSNFGFINNQPEFDRMTQLARIVGSGAAARKNAMIAQSKQNYVYHIVRNKNHSKQEKLDAIERIMGDGKAAIYYQKQQMLHAKEQIAALIGGTKALFPRLKGRLNRAQLQKKIAHAVSCVDVHDITLISQNCIGGVLYHDLGMQFLSPTVNTFIPEPDFVKFVLNLRHYMAQELVVRWDEEYPIGILDDITIHFMHYETCRDANATWNRRMERINWDKIFVLATDRDGFDAAVYEQWKRISYPKVLFTAHPEFTEDAIFFPEYEADGQVGDLISDRHFYRDGYLLEKIKNRN